MGAPEVPDHVVDYLDRQRTLTLATSTSAGVPHAATLVYVNRGPLLYIWLRQSAATAGHVERSPEVAFAIDEYAEDWRQTKGIQGTGECAVVTDGDELGSVAELFGSRFPDLRPGATSAVSFFRITPTALHYIDNTRGEGDPEPDEYRREAVIDGSG